MATRFYLPSTGAAAVSPAYGGWGKTSSGDRLAMVQTKISSAMANKSAGSSSGTHLVRQYVSEPLPAQTISGTVSCYARCLEDDSTDIIVTRLLIRVCSNDGTSYTGTLLSLGGYGPGTDFDNSLKNRIFADGDSLSSLAINANDRLVIEMGYNSNIGALDIGRINFGDNSGTDLGENETETAANNPWIEFSADLFPLTQSVTDAISLADALALNLGKVLTEAMTLSEALALKTGKVVDDALSLTDAVGAVLLRTVSISDALSILDALSLKVGKPISDTMTLADTVSAMLLSLPSVQDYYMPRPLITLTIGAETKRYSTETFFVPTAGQVGVAQVGESQVGG